MQPTRGNPFHKIKVGKDGSFTHGKSLLLFLRSFIRGWSRCIRIVVIAVVIHNSIGTDLDHLFHYRVKGRTTRTLDSQKVPLSSMGFGFTVVAHDIDNALEIGRHGMFGNVTGPRLPSSRHGLLTDDRLFANGTAVIKAGEFAKAVRVNGVSTRQVLR